MYLAIHVVVVRLFFLCRRFLSDNVITNVGDAGIAVMESFDIEVYDNLVVGALNGIRFTLGSGDSEVYENTFEDISAGEKGVFFFYRDGYRDIIHTKGYSLNCVRIYIVSTHYRNVLFIGWHNTTCTENRDPNPPLTSPLGVKQAFIGIDYRN